MILLIFFICVPLLMSPRKQGCAGFPLDATPLNASRDDPAVGQEPLRGSVDRKRRTGQARPLRRDGCGHSQGPGRELVKGVP